MLDILICLPSRRVAIPVNHWQRVSRCGPEGDTLVSGVVVRYETYKPSQILTERPASSNIGRKPVFCLLQMMVQPNRRKACGIRVPHHAELLVAVVISISHQDTLGGLP